jgi:hypothetical protein
MKATSSRAVRALAARAGLAANSVPTAIAILAAAALIAVAGSTAAAASPAAPIAPSAPGSPGAGEAPGKPAAPANFSGRWIFSPARSANVGMMASLELHATVEQSPAALSVHEDSSFQGQKGTRDLRYDLGGKPVPNPSPMGDPSETVSRWDGSRLVTTWTSQGAVAGTKVVRTETRTLSADGRTMTLESVRGSAAPMVMVFARE